VVEPIDCAPLFAQVRVTPGECFGLFGWLRSGAHFGGRVFDQAGASVHHPSRAGVPAARRI